MRALFVSPRLIEGARFIMGVYRAHLKTSFLMYLQYRASSVLWLLDMVLGPVIYLVVWSTIARANGGVVDGYRAGDFAAYFLVLLLVNHLTDNWVYYEFEGRVRQGLLSPLLLRPIHPIHADVAQNLTYKWMMLVVMLPTAGVLALVFPLLCRTVFPLGPDGATYALPGPRAGAGANAPFPVDAGISGAAPAGTVGPAGNITGIGCPGNMALFKPGPDDCALAPWATPLLRNGGMSMRYIALLRRFLQLNILRELAYRGNFYTQIFQSLLSLGFGLLGLAVIFGHTSTLNEWHPAQILVLLGVYQLVGGVINLIIQPCMQQLMREVHQGTLDFTLLKPEDAQFLVSIRQLQMWKLCDIVLGLAVVGIALAHPGAALGAGQVLTFLVALVAGGCIVYSFWLVLATCSFWFVHVENILVIFQDLYQAGRWPVSIYPSWLRWTLTFLVPVTVATTIPAQALIGQLAWSTLLGVVLFALLALVLSRRFWLFGLRHYTGASA